MSQKVWLTNIIKDYSLGDRLGLRYKDFDDHWRPAQHKITDESRAGLSDIEKYVAGYSLDRKSFPESVAIFDEKCFRRAGEIFSVGGFLVTRKSLADVIRQFDMGSGELIPIKFHHADLKTEVGEDFYFINFGCRKNTVVIKDSKNIQKITTNTHTLEEIWKINNWVQNSEIILTSNSLIGPDLWFEERFPDVIFMSDRLVSGIRKKSLKVKFSFVSCEIREI